MLQADRGGSPRDPPEVRKVQSLLAEFVGTMFLVLVARLTSTLDDSPTAAPERRFLALGFTISALIYAFDHISGAHFNPAVTLGMVVSKHMRPSLGVLYVLSQCLGAMCGGLLSRIIGPPSDDATFTPSSTGAAWAVEFIFTFALILVQQNAGAEKNKKEPNSYFGIAVAFTVLAGACATFPISGGCFNPAIGLGVEFSALYTPAGGSMSNLWIYWSAPLAGALVASGVKWYQNLPSHRDSLDLPAVVPLTELTGTFLIVLTASLTSGEPLAIGSMVLAMVYMGDHVCGADYNPAVSLAMALRFGTSMGEWWKVGVTVAAQFVGAIAAALAAYGIKGEVNLPNPGKDASAGFLGALLYEALWTTLLVYVACAVMTPTVGDKEVEPEKERMGHSRSYQGLALGFIVAGGVYGGSGSGSGSGGVFNPALGSAILLVQATLEGKDGSFVWVYLVGPTIGAFAGAGLFSLLHYHVDPELSYGAWGGGMEVPLFMLFTWEERNGGACSFSSLLPAALLPSPSYHSTL